MNYQSNDLVKTCRRLESGLRLGIEGLRACQFGAFASPIYWSADEASQIDITKEMIIEKRKWLFGLLNDPNSDFTCKRCLMVRTKRYGDIDFTKVGQIDLAASTICNLRCKFCGINQNNLFSEAEYDALAILREFKAEDVEWDSVVDFNGGEPTLLSNLDEYLEYFASRRIRIRFMTNGVKYHPLVYDGLINGTIQWVCTSVDAGTPSTYLRIKKRDRYLQVLENLTRYAYAGNRSGGMLAIKYIFCGDNCSDDDIAGFTYAMLAIRPHQVWLTFDFSVVGGDSLDFGDYDYSGDIVAYAKMYGLMKKHGLTPVHYSVGHLALICQKGETLLKKVRQEIEKTSLANDITDLILRDFRKNAKSASVPTVKFDTMPLRIIKPSRKPEPWSLVDKKVLLAPACAMSIELLSDPEIKESRVIGFLDRDRVVQGKSIKGIPIYGYKEIRELDPDVILVVSPGQHRADIVQQLAEYEKNVKEIAVFEPSRI